METILEPKIGLEKKELIKSIKDLTIVLSNEMVLYVKSRKFHWNVKGNSFMELHKLFENQYSKLEKTIDEVAERISKLGGKTIGTMKEFIEHSILSEESKYVNQNQMLEELLDDHEKIILQLRAFIENAEETKDAGTADFLTGILLDHESKSWVLRKYLS
ncbi:Dps family protein [Flavobacterium sp. HNIBRBA15423]|uniref:Dps family protein n=1 Tax=Flavobacterium sp. HNIBRBA15423 TaxID=3458683 RepID=UPI004044611A